MCYYGQESIDQVQGLPRTNLAGKRASHSALEVGLWQNSKVVRVGQFTRPAMVINRYRAI